jgi:hypothetical protein
MKSIFVFVPDELHTKFKIKVMKEMSTIKEIILSFITLYVGEEENGEKKDSKIKKDNKKNKK